MLDLWNNLFQGSNRETINEILPSKPDPLKLYLIAAGVFDDLRTIAQYAIDGMLDKEKGAESRFTYEIEIPMYSIIAYCDTHTNIDTRCIIELLHSIRAEITTVKVIGGGPTKYGPKRSKEEIEYLRRQLWITDFRLSNHLYAIATPEQRTGVDEAKERMRLKNEAIVNIGCRIVGVKKDGHNRYLPLQKCIDELAKDFPDCKGWTTTWFSNQLKELCRKQGKEIPDRKRGRPEKS
ncbi:hypothetical protein [uncultured Gimesia sp.]|uniref:hypothetical protein n=1 Tax=uncultured Gimesia sp. TaxID=1678688 RepID=UPI000E996E5A|nr:hypothetical protein [Planctomycetaceae bacterium]HBL48503.1 hypothetical protein [Planctomycetaceae bacterium]|tara:strand:- start:600 stop:1307 length:708 start_codon:yes stop_codon:yes gene_type:complete